MEIMVLIVDDAIEVLLIINYKIWEKSTRHQLLTVMCNFA